MFLIHSTVFSKTQDKTIQDQKDTTSAVINFKLTYGYGNLYAIEGVKQGIYQLNLRHGGGIGFLVTLSDYIDLEFSYYLFYSYTGAKAYAGIMNEGFRFNLIKNNIVPYLGLGGAVCSQNQDVKGGGPSGYFSLYAPLGITCKLGNKVDLDFSARFSLKLKDINIDRIVFNLGIIHDI